MQPERPVDPAGRGGVTVVEHPIVQARLTVMRDERTTNSDFRAALRELATLLVYEATRDLERAGVPVTTPVAPTTGTAIANPPLLVPVLSLSCRCRRSTRSRRFSRLPNRPAACSPSQKR